MNEDYITEALLLEPEGEFCHFCKDINNFADELGWFYISPSEDNRGFCCEKCWNGKLGKEHKNKYGFGER